MDLLTESTKRRQHVTLTRAKINNSNPVKVSTYVSEGGKRVGLLRVPSFNTDTVSQMVDGLRSVSNREGDGKVDAIAIDLRGNVGGYMPAGVDGAWAGLIEAAATLMYAGIQVGREEHEEDCVDTILWRHTHLSMD